MTCLLPPSQPQMLIKRRPCKDAAGRWLSANQGQKPGKEMVLLTPWPWISSLQYHGETHFCHLALVSQCQECPNGLQEHQCIYPWAKNAERYSQQLSEFYQNESQLCHFANGWPWAELSLSTYLQVRDSVGPKTQQKLREQASPNPSQPLVTTMSPGTTPKERGQDG